MYVKGLGEFLEGLDIGSGKSRRMDCPKCGGSNTFSVTNDHGTLLYNCYKAGCSLHGKTSGRFTLEDIQSLLEKRPSKDVSFSPPSYFVQGDMYRGMDTLSDRRENRQVFLVRNQQGKPVDAIGRALTQGVKPKWKRYGSSQWPLVVGPYEGIGVVVEDAYSACAVYATGIYSGVAILGTNIHSGFMDWAVGFKGLIVALDYDAATKGLDYALKLSWWLPTTSVILKRDLKHYGPEEICEQLKQARETLGV
jgi:hypothetical protein